MTITQEHHWKVVKRILRYLGGTITYGMLLCRSSNYSLQGFCDADWGSNIDDKMSTTRYYIYLGSNIVSWSSHKQKAMSRRSIEAE